MENHQRETYRAIKRRTYNQKIMDTITINWLENKGTYLKCTTADGKSLSINAVDKKGIPFPGYADIRPGSTVTGNLWTSEKGNTYLFAPSPKKAWSKTADKTQQIGEAMQRKEDSIKSFQEDKQSSMKIFAAYRDATLMVTAFLPQGTSEAIVKQEHKHWVNYFMSEIDNTLKQPF